MIARFASVLRDSLVPLREPRVTHPFNFYLLSEAPCVILTMTMGSISNVRLMSRMLGERPATFIVGFWWSMETRNKLRLLAAEYARCRRDAPQHAIHFLCNTPRELCELERRGLPATLVNADCFLDERLYPVLPGIAKRFDAVYNARLGPYKRLELARDVPRLLVVTAPYGDAAYERRIRSELAGATWPNYAGADGAYRRIGLSELPTQLNAARVGLVLSASEGACYASCEYQLCGLPVVSTPSRGGRDAFYDDEIATIVDPHPSAVRDGVRRMIERAVPPERVREKTLAMIRGHRQAFGALFQRVLDRTPGAGRATDLWQQRFTNKMNLKCDPRQFPQLLTDAAFLAAVRSRDGGEPRDAAAATSPESPVRTDHIITAAAEGAA